MLGKASQQVKYAKHYSNWLRKHARDLDASDTTGKLSLKAMCVYQSANVIDMLLGLVENLQSVGAGGTADTPPAPARPVAIVAPSGAVVRLQWASVWAAHNAKPGPLFAVPLAEMAMFEQVLKDFSVNYTGEDTWVLETRRPPHTGRSGKSLWSGTDLRTVAAEAYLDLLG